MVLFGRTLRVALPMNQAALRRLGHTVGIAFALAGCTPEQRAATRLGAAQRAWDRNYDGAYTSCIGKVVGAFSSASLEVMKECERQANAKVGPRPR